MSGALLQCKPLPMKELHLWGCQHAPKLSKSECVLEKIDEAEPNPDLNPTHDDTACSDPWEDK